MRDIEFATHVLLQVVQSPTDQERLQHGVMLRDDMHAQLEVGLTPQDDYRWEFLESHTKVVIDFVKKLGNEFNAQHPEDMYSNLDALDLLNACVSILKRDGKK